MSEVQKRCPRLTSMLLAGMLGLSVAGLSTVAEAVPVAQIAAASPDVRMVQYAYGSAHRRYGYHGRAGLYSCAPGHVNTRLARKACGGAKFPRRF